MKHKELKKAFEDETFKYQCECLWSKDDEYGMIPTTSCPVHGKKTQKLLDKSVPCKEKIKLNINPGRSKTC